MKRLSTTALVLLLALLGFFAVMSDSSRAAADPWKRGSGYGQHHKFDTHKHGHRRGHEHFRKHHRKTYAHRHHGGTDAVVAIYRQAGYPLNILPDGDPAWHDPDTAASYGTPIENGRGTATGPCREYITTARIGGREQQIYGTACRQPDGAWTPAR